MNLNLARKWRSRNFDHVVGQDLPIRMLKNSLFLQHYFPVYLFSGQRGCGKTTLARIFASAVNCKNLPAFQADPKKHSVPCLQCDSCLAMAQAKHPDFIEIDAASHTGVDNVRNIIDAACLMPVLGIKKIYLIDEAHMLSKAAFNAFLKILEEPPASVFFILATTDPQKIIDTVVSRCFQLFFKPIAGDLLQKHLAFICEQEKIVYDSEGLRLIVLQTEGSARDALNLLEQVRFSHESISKQAVLTVLGHLDDERLLLLFDTMIHAEPPTLLSTLQNLSIESYSAQILWESCIGLLRSALWLKYGVVLETDGNTTALHKIIEDQTADMVSSYLQIFYEYESLFLKTKNQHRILEMVFLEVCYAHKHSHDQKKEQKTSLKNHEEGGSKTVEKSSAVDHPWHTFLEHIRTLDDPLLLSILKQGRVTSFDESHKTVTLSFAKNFTFFKELIEKAEPVWQPKFQALYGHDARLVAQFNEESKISSVPPISASPIGGDKVFLNRDKNIVTKSLDVSDKETWKKANLLLQAFPGTITEVKGDDNA